MASDEERDLPAGPESDMSVVDYGELLKSLKTRIRHAQLRATQAVNRELVSLYWQIGREILVRQEAEGWGTKVIDRLAADLRREFPEMTGLSRTNLKYMRSLAEAYPGNKIGQQAVGQIPWGHNIVLLTRLDESAERLWYVAQTVRLHLHHSLGSAALNKLLRSASGRSYLQREPPPPQPFSTTSPKSNSPIVSDQFQRVPYSQTKGQVRVAGPAPSPLESRRRAAGSPRPEP